MSKVAKVTLREVFLFVFVFAIALAWLLDRRANKELVEAAIQRVETRIIGEVFTTHGCPAYVDELSYKNMTRVRLLIFTLHHFNSYKLHKSLPSNISIECDVCLSSLGCESGKDYIECWNSVFPNGDRLFVTEEELGVFDEFLECCKQGK